MERRSTPRRKGKRAKGAAHRRAPETDATTEAAPEAETAPDAPEPDERDEPDAAESAAEPAGDAPLETIGPRNAFYERRDLPPAPPPHLDRPPRPEPEDPAPAPDEE
jgi:hypothetical protein